MAERTIEECAQALVDAVAALGLAHRRADGEWTWQNIDGEWETKADIVRLLEGDDVSPHS